MFLWWAADTLPKWGVQKLGVLGGLGGSCNKDYIILLELQKGDPGFGNSHEAHLATQKGQYPSIKEYILKIIGSLVWLS